MSIDRLRLKPTPGEHDQIASRYTPGDPLEDLLKVAQMADPEAELAEVAFPGGRRVLLVVWTRVPDYDRSEEETEYETVEPGDWLAFSSGSGFLYSSDDADWKQFYDPSPGGR